MGEKRTLLDALRVFDAAEANLVRLERLLREIEAAQPQGIVFGSDPTYERRIRAYEAILNSLPTIDDWKPEKLPPELNDIAQARLDAAEIGEGHALISIERWLDEPGAELRDYRFRFDQKRRALVRDAVREIAQQVDENLRALGPLIDGEFEPAQEADPERLGPIREGISQIDSLLGSSMRRPNRWKDLLRHLSFGQLQDLHDIIHLDWPPARAALAVGLYDEEEPVPIPVSDLGDVVRQHPSGPVPAGLQWESLDDEGFERVIFALLTGEVQYENVAWLTHPNAPDRGRDLSADRIRVDSLAGTERQRVVVQCRHWRKKSISVPDVSQLRDQMRLWEPPPVGVLIIATSGRFTTDAVQFVERHNESGGMPRIEMWPDSHLEMLLAARPGIVGRFGLR